MMILGGFLIYAWGAKEGSRRIAIWSAALWLCSPMVLLMASVAYVDVGLTLFVFGGAYGVYRWKETQNPAWLLIGAFLAGTAAGTKYTGLFFVLILSVSVFVFAVPGKRWRMGLLFAIAVLATAAPWYLRNYWLAGDPLFPFLPEIFGSSIWSSDDVLVQRLELQSHGLGRDWKAFLAIWWNISWNQGLVLGESLSSLALIIPMPLLFLLQWRNPRSRWFALLTMPFVVIWFFQAQTMRYLIPIYPFLCLELAALLDRGLQRIPKLRAGRAATWATGIIFLIILIPAEEYALEGLRNQGPIPTTEEARHTYLAKNIEPYEAVRFLNEREDGDYRLFTLYAEEAVYYCEGEWRGDFFGPARSGDVLAATTSGEELYRHLQQFEADYFLVTAREGEVLLPVDGFFLQHFRLIYQNDGVRVFELRKSASG